MTTANYSRGLPMGPATTESSSMVGYIKGRTCSDVIAYENDVRPTSAANVYAGTLVFQNRDNAKKTTTRSTGVVLKRPKLGGDNLPAVQANFYTAASDEKNQGLVFTGVTYDASEDGTMSRNTHLYNETGISILQTGIVNVYCDEDVAKGARFGDTVYWSPEPCKTQHRGLPDDFRPVKLKLGASNQVGSKSWVEKETQRPQNFEKKEDVYIAFMKKKYNNFNPIWYGSNTLPGGGKNGDFINYVIGEQLVTEDMLKDTDFLKEAKDLGISKKDIKKHFMYDPARANLINVSWEEIRNTNSTIKENAKKTILSGNIGTPVNPVAPPDWLVDYVKKIDTSAGFAKESVVQSGSNETYNRTGADKNFQNIVGVVMKSYPSKAVIQVMLVGDIQFNDDNSKIPDPSKHFPLRLPVSIPIPRNPVYIRVFCESHLWTPGMLMFRRTQDNLTIKYDVQRNPLITVTPFIDKMEKENIENGKNEKFTLVGVARDISPEFHGTPRAGHHLEEHPDHITNMMIDGHTTILAHPQDVEDVMVNDTVMWSFEKAEEIDYPEPLKTFLGNDKFLPRVVKFDGESFDRIIGKVSEKYGGHEARLEVLLTFTRGQQGFLTKQVANNLGLK